VPESYLSKVFVSSENVFDFGPLLIGKNPQQRSSPEMTKMNMTTFRVSNQGKYNCKVSFALMSQIMENSSDYKQGVFFFEPEEMEIPMNDLPLEVKVWAIPDELRKFRDDLIIMIKDNPTPVVLPLTCLGCKPQVSILQGAEQVRFDRLLLNQLSRKEVKLKNSGCIGARWKLNGIEALPKEFCVENTGGELAPCAETTVFVTFTALKQQKFAHSLQLEVQDIEGCNVKQELQTIQLEAEAFNINLDLKFPENNVDNMLNFGAVKVGEFKDQTFSAKNTGLYRISLSFQVKKKLFKENFRIEPMKLELEPNQEVAIVVRFCS